RVGLLGSLRSFRRLAESNVVGMIVADLDSGRVTAANEAFLQLVGYTQADLQSGLVNWRDLTPVEYRARDERGVEELRQTGSCPPAETEYVRKDGQRVPVLVGAATVEGAPDTCLVFVADISARRRAEAALRESEARYRSVITALHEGVLLRDAAGIIRACNPSAERILGLSADELIGRASLAPEWSLLQEDGSPFPPDLHPARLALRTGRPSGGTVMGLRRPTGEVTWISVNIQPLTRDGDSAPHGVVTSFTDITASKRAVDRSARLQALTTALAEAITPDEVARVVVVQAASALGASGALVALLTRSGEELELLSAHGYPPDALAAWQSFPASALVPVAEAVRRREPIWVASREEAIDRYQGTDALWTGATNQAWAAVPLSVRGRAIGALGLSFAEPRGVAADDRAFLVTLAQQCGQALERSRLYHEARTAVRDRDQALAAVEAERARLHQVLDVLPEGIRIVDIAGRVILANAAARDIFGADLAENPVLLASDEEATRLFGLCRVDGTPYSVADLPMQRTLCRGEIVRGEQIIFHGGPAGRAIHLLLNSAPLRDASGAIVGGVAVFQDITALKEIERARDDFLSSVSHDLKTPLTTIRGLAQLARHYPDGDLLTSRLDSIITATTQMMSLIGELLDVARLRMGQPLEI
ncbi:MAG TPA: PAS domain S-box protein, partial [Dehalococcoidia bacterium]|nr:PAS domain S-box protein [Dehalococcoidia bacterium]